MIAHNPRSQLAAGVINRSDGLHNSSRGHSDVNSRSSVTIFCITAAIAPGANRQSQSMNNR